MEETRNPFDVLDKMLGVLHTAISQGDTQYTSLKTKLHTIAMTAGYIPPELYKSLWVSIYNEVNKSLRWPVVSSVELQVAEILMGRKLTEKEKIKITK